MKSSMTGLLTVLLASSSYASITYSPGFSGVTTLTHSTPDSVYSFDWDAGGTLTYMTSSGFPDVNVWRDTGGAPANIYAAPSNFVGANVIRIGDYVYFNDSTTANTQNIHRYGPVSGSASTVLTSTTTNSGIYTHNGDLLITGAPGFGTNRIYHSGLAANGTLLSDPAADLGETFGSSGPLAFDADGNMYYAPGFSDLSIYKWTPSQLANAIADPTNNPLPTSGVLWADYSSDYAGVAGGTGMAFDADGDLVLSLTNFIGSSVLVEFDVDGSGAFAGQQQILSTTDRIGDVRNRNGTLYFANGNEILAVIPEPSVFAMVFLGACFCVRLFRKTATLS